jgi:translation initiation factor 1 (eIF-1/SUI1)
VPGIAKEKEIVIQGNLAYDVEKYLVSHMGVPAHLIDISSSKGAKLKKKK